MSNLAVVMLCLSVYLALNFLCALALHRHANRQAHLRLRVMDVVVHFVFLTALAIPALTIVTLMAFFGGEERPLPPTAVAPAVRAA